MEFIVAKKKYRKEQKKTRETTFRNLIKRYRQIHFGRPMYLIKRTPLDFDVFAFVRSVFHIIIIKYNRVRVRVVTGGGHLHTRGQRRIALRSYDILLSRYKRKNGSRKVFGTHYVFSINNIETFILYRRRLIFDIRIRMR